MPMTYIAKVIISAFPMPKACTRPPAIAVKIGNLAPQEKNGITRTVAVLSFSSAKVLVLIIAGTEHPKPIIIGIKERPDKPNFLKIRSKIKATRAIYPESSRIEKNKNKNKICGKKPKTANKPPKTPSQIKPWSQLPSSNQPLTQPVIQSVIFVKKFANITPGELIPASVKKRPSNILPLKQG